jgi:hypothetical protein
VLSFHIGSCSLLSHAYRVQAVIIGSIELNTVWYDLCCITS